jgi:hypothetical protein
MQDLRQIIVNDHIDELRREAEALRTERRIRHASRDGIGAARAATAEGRATRVRVGRWLISLGAAVAGASGDPHGGSPGHAA